MTTRELEQLLREDAARPSPRFLAEMDELVAARFQRERAPRPALARLPRPALAGLASVALAVSVTAALLAGGDDASEPASDRPPAAAQTAAGASAPSPTAAESDDAGIVPGETDRAIERSAQLELTAPGGELAGIAEHVVQIAERHRGFVLRSELSTGDGDGTGLFELRIPQARLRAALADLAALGDVRSRSEQGQDVTPVVSRLEERLDEARAERRGLLRRLERADSDGQARAIRRRLRLVSAEIRSVSRRLRARRERVDYAAVTVSLAASGGDGAAAGGLGEAVDDAGATLEGALGVTIRALAVVVPLGLIAAAVAFVARALWRRRREAALG